MCLAISIINGTTIIGLLVITFYVSFSQACRGERLDSGVTLVSHRPRSETDSSTSSTSYKIPTHADFLMAYSSVEGKVTFVCFPYIPFF